MQNFERAERQKKCQEIDEADCCCHARGGLLCLLPLLSKKQHLWYMILRANVEDSLRELAHCLKLQVELLVEIWD
jgi:hypothetical protein